MRRKKMSKEAGSWNKRREREKIKCSGRQKNVVKLNRSEKLKISLNIEAATMRYKYKYDQVN